MVLDIAWEREQKEWWCGPAAARMALKSWVRWPATQPHLADAMITRLSTKDVTYATAAMNDALERSGFGRPYFSRGFPANTRLDVKKRQLMRDMVTTVGVKRRAMVLNIKSTRSFKLHGGYPNRTVYHYITVIGYTGGSVYVADPASGLNKDYSKVPQKYWVDMTRLATMLHTGNGNHYYSTMS